MSKKKVVKKSKKVMAPYITNRGSGVCPKCLNNNIEYGMMEPDGEHVYYEATCNDCGCTFKEWYFLEFEESISDEDHEVKA